LPRALDPVEAGRDMPLPPERPSSFSLSATTMEDPTAVDVPLPEPKPAIEPAPKSAAAAVTAAPKRKPRPKP
jgi:hypothetical protein